MVRAVDSSLVALLGNFSAIVAVVFCSVVRMNIQMQEDVKNG